ncbi:MAG TPA: DUF1684 domain-containing protein, partial [Steroidobacteraceae bacterium]
MTRTCTLPGLLASVCAALAAATASAADWKTERASVEKWRSERLAELTSDTGWLTLVGLFWLSAGPNSFGRAPTNTLVLDHPRLAPMAGTFVLTDGHVTFTAGTDSGITRAGQPVTTIDMIPDATQSPTVVSSGPLRFFIIERAGKLGVRVRDIDSAWRRTFRGLEYFPIDADWALAARFEPYEPQRRIPIMNVLGIEEDKVSPGALVFTRKGRQFRLDTVLESPDSRE